MTTGQRIFTTWIFPALTVSIAMAIGYRDVWVQLFSQWTGNEDYSYGLLILPISLYLIWENRRKILSFSPAVDWRGLIIMAAAILLYSLGELGAELFTTRVALILFLIGAIWWLYGRPVVRTIAFPLLLLFLMLPLPGFVHRNLTFPLQLISSRLSVEILNTLGFMAYREGNVIDMGFSQFQVVEACNGLRFILPLLCLGILFAFYKPMAWWKRLVLVCITVPLAVATNVLRIAGTGMLSHYFGAEVAQGFFHDFSGWAVFMVCFAFFSGIGFLLSRLPGRPRKRVPLAAETGCSEPTVTQKRLWATAAAVVVCLVSPLAVRALGAVTPMTLKKDLSVFPLELGGCIGQLEQMDPAIWERVGGQKYTIIDYRRADKPPINFYTAYYEYQKKAGDFVHSPKLCLPGAGWFIRSSSERMLEMESAAAFGTKLKINELVIEKSGNWQLVYYWYQGRERNFTSEWAAKFYLVWDGVFRRRTDGALVRLTTSLGKKEQIDAARSDLDQFAVLIARTLDGFLP
jgi:exosortase D (VPLPA-CTERM-specific)